MGRLPFGPITLLNLQSEICNLKFSKHMPTDPKQAPIGLLAGGGRFPIAFAEKAKKLGVPVACVAIRDEASPELIPLVDTFYWTGLTKLGRMIRCFKKAGCKQIVMAGKIHKVKMNTPMRWWHLLPDWRMVRFWFRRTRQDNKDDSILLGVIDEFRMDGLDFASALDFCPELLVKAGLHTRRAPTAAEVADIEFGWLLAKEMGRLDVGQSVMVKEKAVLAVEAIEGTDQAILRAGTLCPRGGFTVVKVAKPQQDMRFDVPTIGIKTIENMKKSGGTTLAVEADKTIIIDEKDVVDLADRYGIAIVAKQSAG